MGLFDKFKKTFTKKVAIEENKELDAYDKGLEKTRDLHK